MQFLVKWDFKTLIEKKYYRQRLYIKYKNKYYKGVKFILD